MNNLQELIDKIVDNTPIIDLHTHLFPPQFGKLYLAGIDELVTYHYLIAEYFTYEKIISPSDFYAKSKKEQADLIWKKIFIDHTPISEAARGILNVLKLLGMKSIPRDINEIRDYLSKFSQEEYMDIIFNKSNIDYLFMTNNPFNAGERKVWESGVEIDSRFKSALRIDDLLFDFPKVEKILEKEGMSVNANLDKSSVENLIAFLEKWAKIMQPYYAMCSVTPEFIYPADNFQTQVLDKVLLPFLKAHQLPFALMFGVKRQVNPKLKLAGDGVGKIDINTVIKLLDKNPDVNFLMTFLSRENIHESAIVARKYGNMRLFGCWWFTNVPFLIEEIVRMRMELVGLNFIPQHSDARIIDQLLYKWFHFKTILKKVLLDKYSDVKEAGWTISEKDIQRDVDGLLRKNFLDFVNK